jgi:hypothetical protein
MTAPYRVVFAQLRIADDDVQPLGSAMVGMRRSEGRLRRIAFAVVAVAAIAASTGVLASASPAGVADDPLSVAGIWNAVYHCKTGWCAGKDFPAPGVQLLQAKGSNKVSDPTGATTGTLVGHTLTLHGGSSGSYTFDETLTLSADGNSWSGTLTDSNHTSGIDTATRVGGKKKFTLSGSIEASSCGSDTCTKKPTPASGITVTASGSEGSSSDTTDKAGHYSITLPKGTYTVKPSSGSRPFEPASKSVTLSQDVGGVDFKTCALDDSAATPTTSTSGSSGVCTSSVKVSFEVSPAKLVLKLNKDGAIVPDSETVKVIVTNTSKQTVKNVRLLTLAAEPVDPTQQLEKVVFPPNAVPFSFSGSFAPGSHASRTFTVKVQGDGEYRFRSLALYDDPLRPGGNGRSVGIGGEFEAIAPLLAFTGDIHRDNIQQRDGTDWIKGGDSWYVGGKLKNLSSHQSLCVFPLFADSDGNAISMGLQDVAVHNATVAEPPFAGLLKPGQSIPLGMLVKTSSKGGTNGGVSVDVKAFRAQPGASCELQEDNSMTGAGKPVTKDEMSIADGSTGYVVHVDVSVNPDTTSQLGSWNFFGGFAKGSYEVYGGLARSMGAVAKAFHDNPQSFFDIQRALYGDPTVILRLTAEANSRAYALTELLVNYFETVKPKQSQGIIDAVGQTFDNVDNDAYRQVSKLSAKWSEQWTSKLEKAYENGNSADVWAVYGDVAGQGVGALQSVFLQLFLEKSFTMIAADQAELEKASELATSEPETLTTSKGGVVKASRILTQADQDNAWGFTEKISGKLRTISKRFNVLIGARSRQTISIQLEKLGAVWKNSNFHQKTVSAIDRLYLRMQTQPGLLAFRSFTEEGAAAARAEIEGSSLSTAEKTEALSRLEGRIAENGSDFNHIKELLETTREGKKGWVKAGFNATESGRPTSTVTRWRRFTVKETPIHGDGGALLGNEYVPYEENIEFASAFKFKDRPIPPLCIRELGTVMCPITGDIDLVYITDVYGQALSSEKMLEVFKALEEAGFAHTDLVTWTEQQTGQFFFPGKEGQLKGLAPGAESTVQFAPDGKERATYIDLRKSIPLGAPIQGPNSYQLDIQGGYVPGMS